MANLLENTADIPASSQNGVNADNSYEELKSQVNQLKEEYMQTHGCDFRFHLFVDDSSRAQIADHEEIKSLIKSNSDLLKKESNEFIRLLVKEVLSVKNDTSGAVDNIFN